MGTVLVPGGNDSLILFGLPLLWPSAWLAGVRQPVRGADPYRVRCAPAPSGRQGTGTGGPGGRVTGRRARKGG